MTCLRSWPTTNDRQLASFPPTKTRTNNIRLAEALEEPYPYAGLGMDAGGDLFGTTYEGGTNNPGNVFELKEAKNGKWSQSAL